MEDFGRGFSVSVPLQWGFRGYDVVEGLEDGAEEVGEERALVLGGNHGIDPQEESIGLRDEGVEALADGAAADEGFEV